MPALRLFLVVKDHSSMETKPDFNLQNAQNTLANEYHHSTMLVPIEVSVMI